MNSLVENRKVILNRAPQELVVGSATSSKLFYSNGSYSVPVSYDNAEIVKEINRVREEEIKLVTNEIIQMISRDEFIDGELSSCEEYIEDALEKQNFDCIKEALSRIYTDNFSNSNIVVGFLMMISRVPYDEIEPFGPLMALAAMTHKDLEVRDRAIQCFERWNSKKGLEQLTSVECSPKWLNDYKEKVIKNIEREGIE